MAIFHIFNPENDLALAFGGENYTAPPLAAQMKRDLRMLPLWLCADGDAVIAELPAEVDWLNRTAAVFDLDASAVLHAQLPQFQHCSYQPWGWSHHIRKQLLNLGANDSDLPSVSTIDRIRALSHRRISIAIHNRLNQLLAADFSPVPVELCDFPSVVSFATANPACYLKAPWSGSGHGIFRVYDVNALDFIGWCKGILKRQGSVLCEPALPPIMDFAMEFLCTDGKAHFCGYSVFSNDRHDSFDTGKVLPSAALHSLISSALGDESLLISVRQAMEQTLTELVAPSYSGYLGVDMLVYSSADGSPRLNPCIELNLRCTMGVLTSIFGDRFLAEGSSGTFRVEYHKLPFSVADYATSMMAAKPLSLSGHKIVIGVQFLTPVHPDSRYCAYIDVTAD